jgi:hypothetical protein
MKHAVLIIAHGNFQHLVRLIGKLDSNYQVYIHLDRKQFFSKQEMETLTSLLVVKGIYNRYKINWAGFNMLKAILYLLKKAISDKENEYFHLLSGQDYPVKQITAFTNFMEVNRGKEFLEYHTLPYDGWDNRTYRRYEYFFLYDLFNFKTEKGRLWILKMLRIQMKYNLKRQLPNHFETIYGGCCWFTLSRKCILYVLEYTREKPSFYQRLKYTFAPEETYFHSIILNSPFKVKVENCSLRYVDWTYRNGNYPANLSIEDFEELCTSEAFFARKFDEKVSGELVNMIDKQLEC